MERNPVFKATVEAIQNEIAEHQIDAMKKDQMYMDLLEKSYDGIKTLHEISTNPNSSDRDRIAASTQLVSLSPTKGKEEEGRGGTTVIINQAQQDCLEDIAVVDVEDVE